MSKLLHFSSSKEKTPHIVCESLIHEESIIAVNRYITKDQGHPELPPKITYAVNGASGGIYASENADEKTTQRLESLWESWLSAYEQSDQ
ncbi:MAG: hypothetical protein ACKV2Q_36785 [Planctomycetaceae bacterium]